MKKGKSKEKNINLVDSKKRANLKKALIGGAVVGAGLIGLSGAANADIILRSGSSTKSLTQMVEGAGDGIIVTGGGAGSTMRCGLSNTTSGVRSTASGGASNCAIGDYSAIDGGSGNKACGNYSTISGGTQNQTRCYASTVSGGTFNEATATQSTVSGGECNLASEDFSAIGGGYYNSIDGCYSVVAGGIDNTVTGECSGILGGSSNCICSTHSKSFIIGSNIISQYACTTHANCLYACNLSGGGDICSTNGKITLVSSDERLKKIQGHYCEGTCVIEQIQPIKYTWKDRKSPPEIGFSAQNIEKLIPEAIGKDNDGYLTLSNRPIIAALVNTVKEQEKQIQGLNERVKKLEEK
jgi:hypothetical protein